MSCGGKFGFGALVDEAFVSCCEGMIHKIIPDATTPTFTTVTASTTSTAPTPAVSSTVDAPSASPITSTPITQISSSSTRATFSSTPIQPIDVDYPRENTCLHFIANVQDPRQSFVNCVVFSFGRYM